MGLINIENNMGITKSYCDFYLRTLDLSRAESDIAVFMLRGFSNREIGENIFLSEKTVKFHISRIFKKFNNFFYVKKCNRVKFLLYFYYLDRVFSKEVKEKISLSDFGDKNEIEGLYRSFFFRKMKKEVDGLVDFFSSATY